MLADIRKTLGFGDGDPVDALPEIAQAELHRLAREIVEEVGQGAPGLVELGMQRRLPRAFGLDHGGEERALVGEMPIERRLRDARGPRDLVDAGALEAAGQEHRPSALEHLGGLLLGAGAGRLAGRGDHGHGGLLPGSDELRRSGLSGDTIIPAQPCPFRVQDPRDRTSATVAGVSWQCRFAIAPRPAFALIARQGAQCIGPAQVSCSGRSRADHNKSKPNGIVLP